jgi:hypothetical protein
VVWWRHFEAAAMRSIADGRDVVLERAMEVVKARR